eukprot:6468044-Amphidinium_carterae.1
MGKITFIAWDSSINIDVVDFCMFVETASCPVGLQFVVWIADSQALHQKLKQNKNRGRGAGNGYGRSSTHRSRHCGYS